MTDDTRAEAAAFRINLADEHHSPPPRLLSDLPEFLFRAQDTNHCRYHY